jgi:zinc metalloprotease ZmpB
VSRITAAAVLGAALTTLSLAPGASAAPKPPPSGSTTAPAQVFAPNPVADLENETLTDQKDADYPALAPAYYRRTSPIWTAPAR